jgi:hypothetical protein
VATGDSRRTVVAVSAEEWDRDGRRRGDLVDFLAASPLREDTLEVPRAPSQISTPASVAATAAANNSGLTLGCVTRHGFSPMRGAL